MIMLKYVKHYAINKNCFSNKLKIADISYFINHLFNILLNMRFSCADVEI